MIWFTSDTHFGHKNIIQYCNRPFADTAQMDECLMDNWNSRVGNNDFIYHLGDFSFCNTSKTINILNRLNGRKALILGNHDQMSKETLKCFSYTEKLVSLRNLLDNSWYEKAHEEDNLHVLPIVLCHFPMIEWDQSHRGSWQLHGHSHGKLEPNPRRQYDVGVDNNNYAPVSLDELMVIMRTREVRKHHE